ncbi:MAG: hypothetical protein SF066_12985 [Thermoanaerobaculia bacterium]|nr:hypothetical protein [Thermoanaerobaculia bacterium]
MLERVLGCLLALSGATLPLAAQPSLVANLNTGPGEPGFGVALEFSVEHEGVRYFVAHEPTHGHELWRSDGRPAGTYRLTDLCPGSCGGVGTLYGFVGGKLMFQGNDGSGFHELWRTDGAVGGEEPVADLCKSLACERGFSSWQLWADRLWLVSLSASRTPALWSTDGTPTGTFRAGNLCRDFGLCSANDIPSQIVLVGLVRGGEGLLLRVDFGLRTRLYRTDGSPAGTVLLNEEPAEPATGALSRASANDDFFVDGTWLWRTDGTVVGTHRVRDLAELVPPPSVVSVQASSTRDGVFDAVLSSGLWLRSDGTSEGTLLLGEVGFPHRFVSLGSRLFVVTDGGLWTAEGAPAVPVRIFTSLFSPQGVAVTADHVFVLGSSRLWISDGTALGSRTITLPEGFVTESELASLGPEVVLGRGNRELWRVDATGQAARIAELIPSDGSSQITKQVELAGKSLFVAEDTPFQSRLYASNGTPEGTVLLDPEPAFEVFLRVGRKVYYSGVRVTDGTLAGTAAIHTVRGPHYLEPVATLGNRLIFAGHRSGFVRCNPGETELWISDGRKEGTRQIADLNPYSAPGPPGATQCDAVPLSSEPGPGATLGGKVLFSADDLVHGRELFVTDGTRAGTRLVADIHRGTVSNSETNTGAGPSLPAQVGIGSSPTDLVTLGRVVLFVADDGRTGRELWVSDGTSRGTKRLADLAPGPASSFPRNLVVVGRKVFFFARVDGAERLFATDGTARGTVLVSSLVRQGAAVLPGRQLVASGGKVYFDAATPASGVELWESAGTEPTTRLVADLYPGFRGSLPRHLLAVPGGVVFAASDGETGYETWWSDGRRMVALGDIAPGPDASSPGPFERLGRKLLTGADDGVHGRELWSIPLDLD